MASQKETFDIFTSVLDIVNPKQAGPFWNLVQPGGGRILPPCVISLFENQ